jgi:uncharacterized protein (TIGR03067 family)
VRTLALMVLTACCLVVGAATLMADDTAKKDLDALQGTWKVESLTHAGNEAPADDLKQISMVVKDDKYTISASGKELETGTIKLDPSKKPKTIEFDIATGNDKGKTQLGIYELKDDTFKFCMARAGQKERPTELASTKKNQTILTVAKRAN